MIEAARRRTGAELQRALLEAAWAELAETGYARMTMASVAARAGTSEPVLYRRWKNKDELTLAAFEYQRETHPVEPAYVGNLRDDLIAELTAVSRARAAFFVIASAAAFSGLRVAGDEDAFRVRERVIESWPVPAVREVYRRAAQRGELNLDRIPRDVLEMPFDLVRHDLLQNLVPPAESRLKAIVDDLFLPLVAYHS